MQHTTQSNALENKNEKMSHERAEKHCKSAIILT